ncbi:ABC transporter ATP-binding protein [Aureimonas sp. ME7]|uniref:ABC transporter ATP-binding protein n=1 Tax=Aureimonas sp. ME7 TaxID=2744252 RepID=UPI0015F5892F|nr:ABC transporter ATP-binding protein [Aureimonas sp. ME7]
MTAVDVSAVAKSYGKADILSDISTHFTQGSFTSLLGPSGSGKTTLLRIIAGFVAPDRGKVTIGGRDVTNVPVWARNIGMVFQSYALFPHMSVADNVAFGLARRGIRGAQARQEVDRALEMVRLPGFGERKPKQLSGGQQQRVALARAIVTRPSVLLLDEPLSALDRRLRQEMQVELVRIQRESGLTTIFVTHDQEEALTLSDKVAILDRGRIVQIGAPTEVYERPANRFAAEFLGDTNFLDGTVEGDGAVLPSGERIVSALALPPAGQRVTLAVRPEKIDIGDASGLGGDEGGPGVNRLPAVIRASIYSGTAIIYDVEAAGGLVLKVFAQNRDARLRSPGDPVTLSWSANHTVPLAAD